MTNITQKTSSIINYCAVMALMMFLLASFLSPYRFFRVAHPFSISWSDAFLIGAVILAAVVRISTAVRLRLPSLFVLSAVVIILSTFTTWINIPNQSNFVTGIKYLTSVIFVPFACMVVLGEGEKNIRLVLRALVAAHVLMALMAILDKNGFPILGFLGESKTQSGRVAGATFHPVWLANTCVITFPFLVYFLFRSRSILSFLFLFLACMLMIYTIINTGSRSALAVLCVSVLPFLFFASARVKLYSSKVYLWLLIPVISFYLILLLSWLGPSDEINSAINRLFYGLGSAEKSDARRIFMMSYAWKEFIDSPFWGKGFDNIWLAHSSPLSLLHSAGIFGAAGYVIWLSACLLAFLYLYKLSKYAQFNRDFVLLFCALFASFLAWFLNGLIQPYIAERSGYYTIGLMYSLYITWSHTRLYELRNE